MMNKIFNKFMWVYAFISIIIGLSEGFDVELLSHDLWNILELLYFIGLYTIPILFIGSRVETFKDKREVIDND